MLFDLIKNDQDFTPYDLVTAQEYVDDYQLTQEFRLAFYEDSSPLK